ncbi:MAG: signal recognition particle-docking protein FtsY [Rhodospirillaceae bacterium]|nr:signal recognition particle-docking protein FtsY [Rhodospirillaceae bacterium]
MTSSPSPHAQASGRLARLKSALSRGRAWLGADLRTLLAGPPVEETFEALETRLLMADVGVDATRWLLDELDAAVRRGGANGTNLTHALQRKVCELLTTVEQPLAFDAAHRPFVVLIVGVNGAGKTTTIGKLAARLSETGRSVMLAAGDTFRAGAIEQVRAWAGRTGCSVVAQSAGADPAAVVFDALESARARAVDVVLADTAGRLHTAAGLMDQLRKVRRVMARAAPSAPHETLLVLDATQGQNALAQARAFDEALGVTGLVITKLDGTAKGGILLAIARELALPVRFIATGEELADLQPFDARAFTQALFAESGR